VRGSNHLTKFDLRDDNSTREGNKYNNQGKHNRHTK